MTSLPSYLNGNGAESDFDFVTFSFHVPSELSAPQVTTVVIVIPTNTLLGESADYRFLSGSALLQPHHI
jgi:hypothetical protein